jgi:hypothetical protein
VFHSTSHERACLDVAACHMAATSDTGVGSSQAEVACRRAPLEEASDGIAACCDTLLMPKGVDHVLEEGLGKGGLRPNPSIGHQDHR